MDDQDNRQFGYLTEVLIRKEKEALMDEYVRGLEVLSVVKTSGVTVRVWFKSQAAAERFVEYTRKFFTRGFGVPHMDYMYYKEELEEVIAKFDRVQSPQHAVADQMQRMQQFMENHWYPATPDGVPSAKRYRVYVDTKKFIMRSSYPLWGAPVAWYASGYLWMLPQFYDWFSQFNGTAEQRW